jgi:hypothetical protein
MGFNGIRILLKKKFKIQSTFTDNTENVSRDKNISYGDFCLQRLKIQKEKKYT